MLPPRWSWSFCCQTGDEEERLHRLYSVTLAWLALYILDDSDSLRTYVCSVNAHIKASTLDVFSSALVHLDHLDVPGYWIVRVHLPSLLTP